MKKIALLVLFVLFLTSCQPVTPAPTPTPTDTLLPTATTTPLPSPTPTPLPIEGKLFFDMNGSGLQDEATFQYDPARLTDARQPLLQDLLAAVKAYAQMNPDLKTGDLITIQEPGLSGFTICVQSECVQTDGQGNFSLPNTGGASSVGITITDPNAGTPALEMRYINQWKGPVIVPAFIKDVDAATMAKLTAIPSCDADAAASVCKQDADTLQVRDQHLNDTAIIPIGSGLTVEKGQSNEIGLMQGFITYPFKYEQLPSPYIFDYFDIIGNRFFDDAGKNTYTSSQDGIMLSYDGKYNHGLLPYVPGFPPVIGVGDSHTGLDFFLPIGTLILSGAPTSNVWYLAHQDGELRVDIMFSDPGNRGNYSTDYGHLTVQLVIMGQKVYRGQIVGLFGNTGINSGGYPQLHFNLQDNKPQNNINGWTYIDINRYIVNLNPLPANFWGSPVSYWTSDNNPQFSK